MERLSQEICTTGGGIKHIEIRPTHLNTFYKVSALADISRYTRKRKRDSKGEILDHKLSFTLLAGKQELEEWLNEFSYAYFIILITDYAGNIYQMGNENYPCEFLESYDTGETQSDINGYEFEFEAKTVPL